MTVSLDIAFRHYCFIKLLKAILHSVNIIISVKIDQSQSNVRIIDLRLINFYDLRLRLRHYRISSILNYNK